MSTVSIGGEIFGTGRQHGCLHGYRRVRHGRSVGKPDSQRIQYREYGNDRARSCQRSGSTRTQNSGSVYQAVSVTSQALAGGGVTSASSTILPSYTLAYDPSAPFANLQGMVAAPRNVDPVAETADQISASVAFRANLAVIEAANKNFKTLLDTLA